MRDYRYLLVDVFTDTPLAGNQLAVFTNATGLSEERMQSLAREIGFSETTFVLPAEQGGDFRMRIFTPLRELPFAGHPTLGTAFAMAGPLQSASLRLETLGGIVPVHLEREGAKIVYGWMEQPLPTVSAWPDPEPLLDALGLTATVLPVEVYDNAIPHVYVMLDSFDAVAAAKPDPAAIRALAGGAGINVFAVDGYRVKTRVFIEDAPAGEDAATGSAAGPLAVHLARHGIIKWGERIDIEQGTEMGRPSKLYATAYGEGDVAERVEVGGSAVVVARGEFRF